MIYRPVTDRTPMVYLDSGVSLQSLNSLAVRLDRRAGSHPIPVGAIALIVLHPKVGLTAASITSITESGTVLGVLGGRGFSLGAFSIPKRSGTDRLHAQARVISGRSARLNAAKVLFEARFGEGSAAKARSLNELRGREGVRMKRAYRELAAENSVDWVSRRRTPAVSQRISMINAALYGWSVAMAIHLGCSPALGVLHSGSRWSLAFDIADLVKLDTAVPLAMEQECGLSRSELVQALSDRLIQERSAEKVVRALGSIFS